MLYIHVVIPKIYNASERNRITIQSESLNPNNVLLTHGSSLNILHLDNAQYFSSCGIILQSQISYVAFTACSIPYGVYVLQKTNRARSLNRKIWCSKNSFRDKMFSWPKVFVRKNFSGEKVGKIKKPLKFQIQNHLVQDSWYIFHIVVMFAQQDNGYAERSRGKQFRCVLDRMFLLIFISIFWKLISKSIK